tara:strand:+ start:11069 stop:11827 length:759 start_codon:yes stop_codon:yes gene_type:complete
MIQAQELRDQLAFALDAEGSDHYIDDLDYIPAMNAAIKWLTNVVNSAFGKDKIGEEFFRDLTYSGVFRTDDCSRVSLNVFPNDVWSILAIYINPETREIPGQVAPLTPNDNDSYFINNLLHKSSFISCKRLSIEEWATSRPNPFEDGYDGNQICDELKRYAYLNPINYENTNVGVTAKELEVRPSVNNDNLTVFWVKKPGTIDTLADNIEYPESVFQLLFNKSLNYISYKQGDNTTIHSVTDKDIALLLNVI